jgi:hypothetical protein
MIHQDIPNRLKIAGLSLLLCLSVASFVYLNSVNATVSVDVENIYVEEVEQERKDILPDVQLLKMLMHKTLEFMTLAPRF